MQCIKLASLDEPDLTFISRISRILNESKHIIFRLCMASWSVNRHIQIPIAWNVQCITSINAQTWQIQLREKNRGDFLSSYTLIGRLESWIHSCTSIHSFHCILSFFLWLPPLCSHLVQCFRPSHHMISITAAAGWLEVARGRRGVDVSVNEDHSLHSYLSLSLPLHLFLSSRHPSLFSWFGQLSYQSRNNECQRDAKCCRANPLL